MGIESLTNRTHKVDCRRLTTKQLKAHIKRAKNTNGLYKKAFIDACKEELKKRPFEKEAKPFDVNELFPPKTKKQGNSRSKTVKKNKSKKPSKSGSDFKPKHKKRLSK